MRFGTGGIFTKRRDFTGLLPHAMYPPVIPSMVSSVNSSNSTPTAFEDILPSLLAGSIVKSEASLDVRMLPLYQRQARDRLARRVKTLRKALSQQEKLIPDVKSIDAARDHAITLQMRGAVLRGDGRLIDEAFKELKRLENAAARSQERVSAARKALESARFGG
jgi:hypothetical protein